jgi:hypothetical protein
MNNQNLLTIHQGGPLDTDEEKKRSQGLQGHRIMATRRNIKA